MAKLKTGAAVQKWRVKNGKRVREWYACISWVNESGKRRQRVQKPDENTKTAAKKLARDMLVEHEGQDDRTLDRPIQTFAQLADFYSKTYLVEPEYVEGRKIAGLRSKYELELQMKVLRAYFGNRKLRQITHGDLQRYKTTRLKTPVVLGKNTRGTEKPGNPTYRQRSITTVHRELALLRRLFNVALQNGWILRNPFMMGDSLINTGDEKQRERILTRQEEEKLLAACTGDRAHLRPIVIMALDTGMRSGEMLKLKWSDIDFDSGMISIQAFNTKTLRERQVAMTARLAGELRAVWEKSRQKPDDLVFGITTSVKKAFSKARMLAGIPDVRFHDLRHTHATRLVSKHLPLSEVGRVLGHTQANTTYRYVNANADTARRAAAVLDEFNSDGTLSGLSTTIQ